MKQFGIVLLSLVLFTACQKSESEKLAEKMNADLERSEMQGKRDTCKYQNIINSTNVDCDAKFPVPDKQ